MASPNCSPHPYRATIPPVPEGIARPLWSVMIPTYNCAAFLEETLTSVLSQDPGPEVMQIEVVDDHSTKDDPEAVVQRLGGGRVKFYRQPQNVGYINNFETCLQRSRGHLIHLLHGDDYLLNGFYNKIEHLFEQHPEIGAAFCRHIYMNEQGHWQSFSPLEQSESGVLSNWLERIASGQRVTTPSIMVRREVYEHLGGFDRRFTYTGEDWEMWVRIATEYPVAYEVQPLAVYRLSSFGSLTQRSIRTGKFFEDLLTANDIIQSYLPHYLSGDIASKISKQAKKTYASWAITKANEACSYRDLETSRVLITKALKSYFSVKIAQDILRLVLRIELRRFKQLFASS